MLLLKLVGPHRQSVTLIHRLVKLPVHTLYLGASLTKVPVRLLEIPAKRTKLEAEAIRFGLPQFEIVRNVRIERQEQVCLRLRSRHFVIRSHRARWFGHDPHPLLTVTYDSAQL